MKKIITILIAVSISSVAIAQQNEWSLQECVNHALAHNITVKQAELNTQTYTQSVVANKGQFLPSFGASASQNVSIGSGYDQVTFQELNNQTKYTNNFSVNMSQSVFNGFRTLNLYKQSKLQLEASTLELAKIKDDISLNVVNSYLNILFNQENVNTALSQVNFSKAQLSQVQELVDAGVQPKANLYTIEATLANDEQRLVAAENNVTLAKLGLAQLLQVPAKNFEIKTINVGTPTAAMLYASSDNIYNFAVTNRSEIKSSKKNIDIAKLGTKIAQAGYYPSVNLNYGYSTFFSEAKEDIIKTSFFNELNDNKGHSIALNISIPIFSRFQNKTSVTKSKIQEENAYLGLEQAKLTLQSNIERAFTDASAALKTYDAAKKSLKAQELAFANAQEQYSIGAMNSYDLDLSRNNLVSARTSLVNAKYDFVFKTKVLDFYAGKSLIN